MSSEMPGPPEEKRLGPISRRDFLKKTALLAVGILAPAAALEATTLVKGGSPAEAQETTSATTQPHWQFLVDTKKCVGCGFQELYLGNGWAFPLAPRGD